MRDAAENLTQAGNQIGEVGQQLADWIRSRASRGPASGQDPGGGQNPSGG